MKGIRIFVRNIGSAMKSISRNFSLSAASVFCTTITLLIVGIAIVLSANINNFTKDLSDSLTIIAFVESDATDSEINNIKSEILEIKSVKSDELIYKTKEDIKNETLENTEEGTTLYTIMNSWTEENNPLEPEFIISVKDVTDLKTTAKKIEKLEKISSVKYSESVIDKMIPLFDIVKKITIGIIARTKTAIIAPISTAPYPPRKYCTAIGNVL